jgi:hypothetical protein
MFSSSLKESESFSMNFAMAAYFRSLICSASSGSKFDSSIFISFTTTSTKDLQSKWLIKWVKASLLNIKGMNWLLLRLIREFIILQK